MGVERAEVVEDEAAFARIGVECEVAGELEEVWQTCSDELREHDVLSAVWRAGPVEQSIEQAQRQQERQARMANWSDMPPYSATVFSVVRQQLFVPMTIMKNLTPYRKRSLKNLNATKSQSEPLTSTISTEALRTLVIHFMGLGSSRTQAISRTASLIKRKPGEVRAALS